MVSRGLIIDFVHLSEGLSRFWENYVAYRSLYLDAFLEPEHLPRIAVKTPKDRHKARLLPQLINFQSGRIWQPSRPLPPNLDVA